MLSPTLVILTALAYLGLLFGVAFLAERRAAGARSLIGNAWVYTLSLAVYCSAWTYFGSVGRAASGGVWFLPIYLGPTLGLVLGWMVVRKMIRIAKTYRITSIADFIASRYGKSPLLAGLVTLITVVGIVPYTALQLKAVSAGYALLTTPLGEPATPPLHWWRDSTLYMALLLAAFTMVFGTRSHDRSERHEGMVAVIAFESVVKLLAFLAVGIFVTWGLFQGPADLFAQARAAPALAPLLRLAPAGGGAGAGAGAAGSFAVDQWLALMGLSMLSVVFLPRQFQLMVVENVDERHLKRAVWAFPLYLLLINLFVLPIALGGLLLGAGSVAQADGFVLSLPLLHGQPLLALAAFVGGLSAATGMVIVETIAVSTMVCNDLVMPLLLRSQGFDGRTRLTGLLLGIRRAAIAAMLLLGYLYFRLAGEAAALVSIGLISFAAVAQFAPALLGGLYWQGGTRNGALAGLLAGFGLWAYTLMGPSLAKSGWLGQGWVEQGPWGIGLLRPEALFGLAGLDGLTHSLVWSLLANLAAFVGLSLWQRPSAREASQALLFVDVFQRDELPGGGSAPVFWRGRARLVDLQALLARFVGAPRSAQLLLRHAQGLGLNSASQIPADARLVQFVETELAGAIGSASARVMVAAAVDEEPLGMMEVMRIVDEASQLRAQAQALALAGAELRAANAQLKGLDSLKDDFMASVTHELRTPLTSIRALSEMMVDDPDIDVAQRQQFLAIIVAETERLTRLVNQVLDLAKIEAGHGDWRSSAVDMAALIERALLTTAELFHARGATVSTRLQAGLPLLQADEDRLLQVMLNLLSNAAKFLPEQQGRVQVVLAADAGGLTVTVQDNGPGVPAAQQALIFERFRQGGDAQHRPQGTGLGLPISRRIVEHFGGRMWLQSDPGQGALFGFTVPWQATSGPTPAGVVQPALPEKTPPGRSPPGDSPPGDTPPGDTPPGDTP